MRYVVLFLLLVSFSSKAEVFQWVDKKGNTHYSDKSHLGAKVIQIKSGYTYSKINKIYDGDTIQLANGNKIRFSGINTPEIQHRNKPAEKGGIEAKQWLVAALKHRRIRLEVDVQKKDKYGRFLAHVFTEDGMHVNVELVKNGWASMSIYPPNLKYIASLMKAEKQAEERKLGIWGFEEYHAKQVGDIGKSSISGWQRVVGRIRNVRHYRKNSYLYFSDTFAVRIAKKSLKIFSKLESYIGKKIEVRGWVRKYKGQYRMFVRHPSSLKQESPK